MALDDFFTLIEMNNGLTAPSRVRELVAFMEKDKDCIAKSFGDSTRQWSVVANAIAATESKDCLDLFIDLDGLQFLDKWLKDAHKFSNDTNDSFAVDFIFLLLGVIRKLHVDCEKLVASGIWTTVVELFVHNSSKVQDKAREIFESWKKKTDGNDSISDVEKLGASTDMEIGSNEDVESGIGGPEHSLKDASLSRETSVREKVDVVHLGEVETAQSSAKSFKEPSIGDDRTIDHLSSPSLAKPTMTQLEPPSDLEKPPKVEISLENVVSLEESKTPEDRHITSCSDVVVAVKSVTETNSQKISGTVGKSSWGIGSSCINSRKSDSKGKGNIDGGHTNQFRSSSAYSTKNNAELNYGIIDPLELARQVAMEVEREMVDYRGEQSCSSSDKLPESNIQKPDSPDSLNGKPSHASQGSLNDVGNDPDISGEVSSTQEEESATSSETKDAEQTNVMLDMETSQITEAAQEEAKKGVCDFDLNQEISSEDTENPENQFLTPVSMVSALRAAAAPEQPVAPLQFEGNLGWKGSASTSAFRPTSSKRQQICLDIDLNMTESVDDKYVPQSSSHPSGESSLETNSRKSERLELDLNHASEENGGVSDWHIRQFYPQGNIHHILPYSSSSSSSKQPSFRNFDLNGQPSFVNDSSDNSYLSKFSYHPYVSGGVKSDDSVISIMGTKVPLNRKDFASQAQTPELSSDANFGRPGNFFGAGPVVSYPFYVGYNNTGSGSGSGPGSEPAMPFASKAYASGAPIQYMMDSRGAPVIPQFMAPALVQTPFHMNMTGSTSNGIGPSRSTLDLDFGKMMESGSGEPAGVRQFLNLGPVRSVDEQIAQPSVSSVGGKRKEPENGWEPYPFNHFMSPFQ